MHQKSPAQNDSAHNLIDGAPPKDITDYDL